ncbi:MAG: pyruvate formate-lyase-activating protein [Spirochaetaceae bacterium]
MEARIHSYETMGSVDGPGLRFITFFQGCDMKCLYCHNRDTWNRDGGHVTNLTQTIEKIEALKGFYKSDSGGFTASGGEPLLQADFLSSLFDSIHTMGLTTAVDTSGHVLLTNKVKEVINKTDYLLLDIKSFDENTHKKLTGVNQDLTSVFIDYIKNIDIKVWLRYVYIPDYTDSDTDLKNLASFINDCKNVERVDILPYHDYGKEKWNTLGYKYPFEDVPIPDQDKISNFKNYLKENTIVIVK